MHTSSDNSDPCAGTHAIISVGNQTFTPKSLKHAECSCTQSSLFHLERARCEFSGTEFWFTPTVRKGKQKKKKVSSLSLFITWVSTHHPVSFSTYAAADTKDPVLVWARRFSSPHACHSVVKASLYTQKRCPSHRQSVKSHKLNTKSSGQNKIFIVNRSLLFLFIISDLYQSLGRVHRNHSDSKPEDGILREKSMNFLKARLWKGWIFGAERHNLYWAILSCCWGLIIKRLWNIRPHLGQTVLLWSM